jgi:cytochrome c2
MKIPITLRIAVLTVATTGFYTYVGQLVPQKEVHPAKVTQMAQDLTSEQMAEIGDKIFHGKGLCSTCHVIGHKGGALRFPDLAGVAERAQHRIPGFTQLDYFAQTLYRPNAFIVPGFNPGMPEIDKPPVGLSDDEIKAVIAFLQTQGGKPTITMATKLPYAGGAPGPGEPGAPATGGAGSEQTAAATPAAGQAPAPAAASTPAASGGEAGGASSGPQALLARYGCTGCHYTDRPGRLEAASLQGVGAHMTRDEILKNLTEHDPPLGGEYASQATLAEIHSMADYLAGLKGKG